jgi:hypothetical protein
MTDDMAPALERDEPVDATEAPETDKPVGSEESSLDFDTSTIPDEYRPQMDELANQWKATYTKKRQAETAELAEVRREAERNAQILQALQNPQTRAAVLQQFGIEYLDEDENDDLAEEPDLYTEVDQLKAWKAEQIAQTEQARREEAILDYVSGEIESLEKTEGREFDANEHRLLDTYARANPGPNGEPDVKGAYELLTGVSKTRANAILEAKKAPRRAPGGTPASKAADLSNKETREARMAEAAEAARASRE